MLWLHSCSLEVFSESLTSDCIFNADFIDNPIRAVICEFGNMKQSFIFTRNKSGHSGLSGAHNPVRAMAQ